MAGARPTGVDIDGETFDLFSIPNAGSEMVQKAKEKLIGSLDLASLVEDFRNLGNFIRVAYNGVAGNTEVQIKVQSVGYKITKLADKSALTVKNFQRASQNVLEELQSTYQYLLDGLEKMALETLSLLTDVAAEMTKAAKELHDDFDQATKDVVEALEATQIAKGTREERKKTQKEEQKQFESQKQQVKRLQKSAREAEENAESLYEKAQAREDKAKETMDSLMRELVNVFTGFAGAAASVISLDLSDAVEKLQKIGDKSEYNAAIRMANEEKMRHLDDMQEQRNIRHDAIERCIGFAKKIQSCDSDDDLADAAIEALHSSVGALKSLSSVMMKAAMFWEHMKNHCESITIVKVKRLIETAITEYAKEERMEVWTSKPFKKKAIAYYSKWVALDVVCGVYMLQIRETRGDLYSYLEENPTTEEAQKNVRELAARLADDLKKGKEKLAKMEANDQKERQSLRTAVCVIEA